MGINPRPAPQTTTLVAGDRRGDCSERGAERCASKEARRQPRVLPPKGEPQKPRILLPAGARGRFLRPPFLNETIRRPTCCFIAVCQTPLRPCGYAHGLGGWRTNVIASNLSLVGCHPAGCLGQRAGRTSADLAGLVGSYVRVPANSNGNSKINKY